MLADVVDGQNIGMVQRGGGARFLLEASEALGIGGHRGRKDLDRYVAPEPRIARAIDLAHPARAKWRQNFIGAEVIARCVQHAGRS